ncbi:glycerophosphoryl diester phosphodiesterase [Microbulbifer donghaiensis]|uniref:glycerophosphodiester phosphodiesterase n=1 Tax=Microbulbifer donghaiensis TaxID=494016 RepID=A0A1M5D4H3_9GAMM|nr:glycerophosphodiester phosphodiesterase [Microbulbifer donghaiensis]SHF61740.1 glycerophosphoryl diester phosphodiesterase [Microbulbifer donghaiensis]
MIRFALTALAAVASLTLTLPAMATTASTPSPPQPIVIAHRGASGYLPEHTLEAKALAYAMRPDFIEQDLVLSKDDHLIVMHDIYLDATTDVAEVFPGRARADGHFYTIDFTLAELKRLRVTSTFLSTEQGTIAKYPNRFPLWQSSFQLSTLAEEIELIEGLNQTLGYDIGIYPEIKKPYFHHMEGKDIAALTLAELKEYGYTSRERKIYLQSFDAEELQRIKRELMPRLGMDLPLIQLIAVTAWGEKQLQVDGKTSNYDYDWMLTAAGLERIASYADGIGPWLGMLARIEGGQLHTTELVQQAHRQSLQVHPYTIRADPSEIPKEVGTFRQLLHIAVHGFGVDGLFTDHPDRVRTYLTREASGDRHN